MNFMTQFTVLSGLLIGLSSCSTQRATLPNGNVPPSYQALHGKELELSQQAAQDAAKSARDASADSEKLHREIEALRTEVRNLSVLASGCSDMAKKAESKRAAAAARAKKEAEEKKALEEAAAAAAAALPTPTANKGEYSKSDAPPGYYPEQKAPPGNDKH